MPTILASIDVTLLDKTKFKRVTRKNGKEAVFCDLVLIETPRSEYGDFMVVQSQPKAERDAGVKSVVLGNAKCSWPPKSPPSQAVPPTDGIDAQPDDVPF